MKEALIHEGPRSEIVESSIPTAGPGEVVIKVEVSGTNPKDWKTWWAPKLPINMGDDIAGTIHEVGQGITGFNVCLTPSDRIPRLIKCPSYPSLETASSLIIRSIHLMGVTLSLRLLLLV